MAIVSTVLNFPILENDELNQADYGGWIGYG